MEEGSLFTTRPLWSEKIYLCDGGPSVVKMNSSGGYGSGAVNPQCAIGCDILVFHIRPMDAGSCAASTSAPTIGENITIERTIAC